MIDSCWEKDSQLSLRPGMLSRLQWRVTHPRADGQHKPDLTRLRKGGGTKLSGEGSGESGRIGVYVNMIKTHCMKL